MDTQFDFERDGCLLVRNAVPSADLDPLIAHIEEAIDEYAQSLRAKGEISDIHEDLPFPDRLVALNRGTEERLRSWNNIAMGEGLYNVICHPGITRALLPILGPGFGFNGDYHVRPKLPNSSYTAFPWHQDSQYYGADSQHALIVTVWIPLVDVDERNGCLQVMPGSQTWGLLHGQRGADMNMRTNRDIDSMGSCRAAAHAQGRHLPLFQPDLPQEHPQSHGRRTVEHRYPVFAHLGRARTVGTGCSQ